MSLQPLLSASPAIQIHAFAAIGAFGLGAVQLAAPKGTLPHRTLGWIWAGLMLAVALSSFWIHTINLWGAWSPIHILSIVTLITLPMGLLYARRHNVGGHKRVMIMLYLGALIIAGIFTFMPGRIMYRAVFG